MDIKLSDIMEVETGKLNPSTYNPQTIDEADYAKLLASIKREGILENLVVNKDGTIISGHKRHRAAVQLTMATVPVRYVDVNKVKEKWLNIAMNKIRGHFDMALLPDLIESIPETERDLTGFSSAEIESMLKNFQPSEEEQDKLDEGEKKMATCPECGCSFQLP